MNGAKKSPSRGAVKDRDGVYGKEKLLGCYLTTLLTSLL
jgi:hypothetical protein